MAIIEKNQQNWYVVDRDEDTFIGITLPLILDNGQEASTKTTIEAVKQNVMNLCSTEAGERVMQPNLGVRLKRFLFQPFSEDLVTDIQNVVLESLTYWLPFIIVKNITVKMSDNESGDFRSTIEISITFGLQKDPSTNESVQITISGN